MPPGRSRRLRVAAGALLAGGVLALAPTAAQAHSLTSSTISTHVTDSGVDATISIALDTLETATGTTYDGQDAQAYADDVVGYLADHLSVTSADGTEWAESFSGATVEDVDGIESFTVDVSFDTAGSDTSAFDLTYDAVIEADPAHEAVVVLTDPAGEVSTAGVLTSSDDTLSVVVDGATASAGGGHGVLDMVGYGFEHVLQGADHLLFLVTLLLAAPLVVVAGRWRRRDGAGSSLRGVLGVVSAFTLGHSVTLVASALGWVDVPSRLVEVLVAASVGVAAVHVLRPLFRRGETVIAAGFGLVHGLAFAGILADLGLDGTPSLAALLAFNVGVELAQVAATLLVFPSLYVLSRSRFAGATRVVGGLVALTAATCWVLDRLGLLSDPLAGFEAAAVGHPDVVVAGLATVAGAAWAADRRRQPPRASATLRSSSVRSEVSSTSESCLR